MTSYDFNGQTVIVTGGTRGIGRGIAEHFLNAGARVIATYASNKEAADAFMNDNSAKADFIDLQCFDVSSYEQVEKFFQYLHDTYENIQVLVNCSGIRKDAVLAMMQESDWQSVIDVNLTGTFNMSKFAVKMFMTSRYGRIINITSPVGRIGFAGQANYAASKAGQVAMTKSLAKEVASRGITVNCVSPGFIDTQFIEDLPEKLRDQYKSTVPMKKFGSTDDVANAVLFLAGKEASYITGTTLEVAGGI